MSGLHLSVNHLAQAPSMKFFEKSILPSWASLVFQLFRKGAESKGKR